MADRIHLGKQRAFLRAVAKVGTIRKAAVMAKVNRRSHWNWMHGDPTYPERYEEARQDYCDSLEEEAHRRAVEGVEEPVFHQGVVCGKKLVYSDTLLLAKLKANIPDKYKDRQSIEHSGSQGIRVVTDPNWYGNESLIDDAETTGAPSAGAALPSPDETAGLRAPLVEDFGGIPSSDEGPRAEAGPLQGSDQRGPDLVGGAELPPD